MKKRISLYTLLHLSATAFFQDTYKHPYAIFGHKSNTKYETIVDEMLYVKNGDTTSPIKAMAFNIENNVVLIFGKNDSLIDRKDIQPEQVLRFISSDPLSAQYPELTPYQFASSRPIQATDIDGLEAYFNNSGEFIKWGPDKSQTAPVILVSGSTSIQLKTVNISQFINRVHWVYGKGGATAADYFASTINNAANKFGEDQMYAGTKTKMKADKVPITSENQKKIYLYQAMPAGKEKVNGNYTGFNTLVGGEDLTS